MIPLYLEDEIQLNPTPLTLSALSPRPISEIASAAKAVQANLVALRTTWCKRTEQDPEVHDIRTPSPGAISAQRNLLIDWRSIRDFSNEEVALRLRQVWGEFCALCWLFPFVDPQKPPDFGRLSPDQTLRCCQDVHQKLEDVQTGLWRMKHEQRLRFEGDAGKSLEFQREHEIAKSTSFKVYNINISQCSDEDLLCCACEYAGMLAALRWASDNRWSWEAPGIMELAPAG